MATRQQLVDALKAHGWQLRDRRGPGMGVYGPPRDIERPTPEGIRGTSAWPSDTYTDLRLLTISAGTSVDGKPYLHVFARTAVPWVRATDRQLSVKRAIEFIEETTRLLAEAEAEVA